MPGQRLRALQQANPISSAPLSPLSARSTKQQQVPFSSFFANYWPSAANAEKSLCAAPLPLLLPAAAGVVVVVAPWWSSSSLPRKPSNFSFHTSSPRRTAIGRITLDCIENTSNGTTTTSFSTTTNAAAAAFSHPAAKASLAVRATEAVVASALATFLASLRLLHLFGRSSARLAANLIVLLRDDSSPRRLFPSHIRSSPPSLPLVQPFLPPSPSRSPSAPTSPSSLSLSPLLLLKEALATSTSLAQVSLQFRPRPDPNSAVPRKAVDFSAAFLEPSFPRIPTRDSHLRPPTRPP